MSEEILKALMQLFAILTSQEGGASDTQNKFVENFLRRQLSPDKVPVYFDDFIKKSKPKGVRKKSLFATGDDTQINESPEEKEKRRKREERKRLREEKRRQLEKEDSVQLVDETPEEKEKRLKKEARRREREALKAADAAKEQAASDEGSGQLTSMMDSIKTLRVCKKINKTLAQPQKIVAFIRLFELIWVDRSMNPNAKELLDTVADVFNISKAEYADISSLTIEEQTDSINTSNILVVNGCEDFYAEGVKTKHLPIHGFSGEILFLKVLSTELYFVKCVGNDNLYMSGLPLNPGQVYPFSNGSTIKTPTGKPIYYSDVVARFLSGTIEHELSFHAKDIEYQFPNGNMGLRGITIEEQTGRLIGIMGASGAGKSTLLNILNGNDAPTKGKVLINGIDIHKEKTKIEGVIGYVPQDDLLLEELTVFENLYFNAKLCLNDKTDDEINEMIINLLKALDLLSTKDLKVGNPLEKTISGGQRKRLNIGLELLREPSVIYMDEPTSGLSSRDSENILDLLKELVLKGKIIFVVIHQPSSDIYKMFDRMLIIDQGGYPVYYGNPVEAIMYFKRKANQVNSDKGQCTSCGNVNPELVFNIISAKLVDDYGKLLDERKVSPEQWNGYYKAEVITQVKPVKSVSSPPPKSLNIPNKVEQWKTFIKRDVLSKLKNAQYMYLTMLEAPILAFVLSFIVRYIGGGTEAEYTFADNQNVPAYIFMSIVVSLFIGLMVSAEEIIKDAKIQKREKFLNLSRGSYLMSKLAILFFISAFQSMLFVLVGNLIMGVEGMWGSYFLALFTVSCFANLLGLNISATFNSVVTIYILIPLILIPQMILSGAMFSFDKINGILGGGPNSVPKIGEVMVSRWAYEALVVEQFKENDFKQAYVKDYDSKTDDFLIPVKDFQEGEEVKLYDLEFAESYWDYKQAYYISEVNKLLDAIDAQRKRIRKWRKKIKKAKKRNLDVPPLLVDTTRMKMDYQNLLKCLDFLAWDLDTVIPTHLDNLTYLDLKSKHIRKTKKFIDWSNHFYSEQFAKVAQLKDKLSYQVIDHYGLEISKERGVDTNNIDSISYYGEQYYTELKNNYTNHYLNDLMRNALVDDKIIWEPAKGSFTQIIDPIFKKPKTTFFAHFYAPEKKMFGTYWETFSFNLIVIWVMGVLLYITLYFDGLKKFLSLFQKNK